MDVQGTNSSTQFYRSSTPMISSISKLNIVFTSYIVWLFGFVLNIHGERDVFLGCSDFVEVFL